MKAPTASGLQCPHMIMHCRLVRGRPFRERRCVVLVTATLVTRRPRKACRARCSVSGVRTSDSLVLQTPAARRDSGAAAERAVLTAISGVKGRGKSGLDEERLEAFEDAIDRLEADGGVPAPTRSPLLDGRWKLLFTTRPGTASPIQRSFTGVEAFSVFQEIDLEGPSPRVINVVEFPRNIGVLRVAADASTSSRPLEGFTPRRGAGLAIFGRSNVEPPAKPDMRIDFAFSDAAFDFAFLPFKVPYPVPFKLLGDETKGFIDVTYLAPDGGFRLSRGNKGTLFVLARDVPATEQLLSAIAAGDDERTETLIDEVIAKGGGIPRPAMSDAIEGRWQLIWSAQSEDANPLQKRLAGVVDNYQVIGGELGPGRLENVVNLLPGITVRAAAACETASAVRTLVDIDDARLELGPFRIPLPVRGSGEGYVDWLYVDDNLRITRGNKGSTFVHVRA